MKLLLPDPHMEDPFSSFHSSLVNFLALFILSFLQVSLTRSPPTYETEGGGRFLLSYDRTVVIKEITSEDVADVHSLLSHYHQVRQIADIMASGRL